MRWSNSVFLLLSLPSAALAAKSGGVSFQPAPIANMFPVPGRWDINLSGAAGVVYPDIRTDPTISVFGLGGVVNRAIDDRWFLNGGLQIAGGSQGEYSVTMAALVLAGGLHFAGSVDDWYALSAVGGLAAVSTIIPARYPYNEVQITGSGLFLAMQAELRAFPWLSVVPYVVLTHLALITVEANDTEVDFDVSQTTASPGFDMWLYLNPANRKNHFSLGVLSSLLTPTSSFIVTLGYGWSFGGPPPEAAPSDGSITPETQPAALPDSGSPSPYLPPAVPPPPPTPKK